MSAFILEPAQFSEIRTGLERVKEENGYDTTQRTLGRVLMTHEHDTKHLVCSWAVLNVQAVNQRYEKSTEPKDTTYAIDFTKGANGVRMTPATLLKHLHCLRYQISEGSVSETDGYKELEDIINALQYDIAINTIDYVSTPWGSAIKSN